MENRRTFFPILLWALFFFLYCAVPLYAQEGLTIRSIKIQGNKRIDSSTINYYVKSEVGQPLSRAQIRKDIEQIYSLGQFKDIRVETKDVEGGVEIVFIVEEIPSVGTVKVAGNEKVESKDILEKIGIKRGATFNEHLVQNSVEEITKIYRDKGFFFATAKIESSVNPGNTVDVIIRIVEGAKVSIENVRFSGNKTFADKELRGQMETKEKTIISFIDDSGIYKKDVLKLDLLRVEGFYHDNGFLRVRVLEPQIEVNKKNKEINITIPVEEGDRYKVSKIHVKGDETLATEEIRKAIVSKEGETYDESQVRKDVLAVTELFSKKGYAYSDVNPLSSIDDKQKTVDITFEIDKGKKVYVGEIGIAGNTRTRDNVIRREFRLKEGDLFDSEKLKRTKQRINNLNFFEDVKIDTKRGKDPELIDIATSVTEKPTGSVTVGAGFSSVENLIFTGSVAQDNLFGRGQKLYFASALSSVRTNYNLGFTDPRLFDSEVLGGVDLFKRQFDYFSFRTSSYGSGLRFGRNLGEYDWLGLNYRYEEVKVSNVAPENETAFLRNETRTTSRIAPTYIHDTRDDFLNPSNGWRHVVRFEVAGGYLGGTDFVRSGYEVTYYHPLIAKLVGMVHAEVNYAEGYSGDSLPIFERYFMGGPNTLRGYTIRDVGPKNAKSEPLGGNESLLINVEAQYPFTKAFRGFVFYDRGNVFGAGDNLSTTKEHYSFSEMRSSIGTGIRFVSPFGPIGLAYGVKLDRREGEKPGEFHFSAGSAF